MSIHNKVKVSRCLSGAPKLWCRQLMMNFIVAVHHRKWGQRSKVA
jgi:hypothetical protein